MSRSWTRVRAFEPDREDWVVLRDRLVVGRVFWDVTQKPRQPEVWRWATITMPSRNGYSLTMEDALERVRESATDKWGHPPYGWPMAD